MGSEMAKLSSAILSLSLFTLFALTAPGQTADSVARVYHPTPPVPSYDVATIKPFDPTPQPGGMRQLASTTLRDYIRGAYAPAAAFLASTQVVGGPEWIDKDIYVIQGKPPGDLELSMRQMTNDDRLRLDHAMRQSLLAERFHLKVHFEVRMMPIYVLMPAKGGLKIKTIPNPASPSPDGAQPSPAADKRPANSGSIGVMVGGGGMRGLRAKSVSMGQLAGILGPLINQTPGFLSLADTGSRPVIDQTGFSGYFDIDNLKWANLDSATPSDSQNPSDLPSLTTALEETLGLRLVPTKGQVEVVVIDSIDHPSEN